MPHFWDRLRRRHSNVDRRNAQIQAPPTTEPEFQKSQDISLIWTLSSKREQSKVSILDLPPELRECIYQHALVYEKPIDITKLEQRRRRKDLARSILHRGKLSAALLSTCKQVHAETAPVLYSQNRFERSFAFDDISFYDLLNVDAKAQRCSNDYGVPDKLTVQAFHRTYRSLVTGLTFRSGSFSGESRDSGLHFFLPMIWFLRNAEGAYFRIHCVHSLTSREVHTAYVAGWRRNTSEKALRPHNNDYCDSSTSFETVMSSDEVVLMITRMTRGSTTCRAPFAIKDMRFKVHVHDCTLGDGHVKSERSISVDDLRSRADLLKTIFIFEPIQD